MPFVRANGIKLYYESRGAGYPVVFLHGFAGTTRMWQPQVKALSRRYQFIVYDARGHGRSDSPRGADQYSADIVADDLRELLRTLQIERAVVGGLSLGGYESLRFYLRYRDLVRALILMDTGPGYRNPQRRAAWNGAQEERARLLEKHGMRALADDPATRSEISYTPREVMLTLDPRGLAQMARSVSAQHDSSVIDSLGKVQTPTLVLVGERDKPFLQAADYMARAIPGARRVVVPNAGHASNIDNAGAFNREVLAFLDSLKLE